MTDKKRIVLVEDQEIDRSRMHEVLDGKYALECFHDGESFLEKFSEGYADVVLMDVQMPGIDGYEACRRLLEIDPDCPVLFISVKSTDEDRLKGYAAGGYDYIVKPFEPNELLAKLRVIIQQRAQQRQLSKQYHDASEAFFTAVKGSSELGTLLHFAESVFDVENYQQLAEVVATALNKFPGMNTSFLICGNMEGVFWSDRGPCPPMDTEVLNLLRDKGRFYEFNNSKRVQINEANVSLLIKGIPEDDELWGRYRDHLHFLLKIASSCVNNLDTSRKLEDNERFIGTVHGISQEVISCESELKVSITNFIGTIETEMERIQDELQFLALSEEQENNLIASLDSAVKQGNQSSDVTLGICRRFKNIIGELDSLLC